MPVAIPAREGGSPSTAPGARVADDLIVRHRPGVDPFAYAPQT